MATSEVSQSEKMDLVAAAPRWTMSLAAFVLICFFMPWLQVSCLGARDTESGFELTRGGEPALWLVPLSMAAVLILGFVGVMWKTKPALFALVSIVSGGLSAFLIYREHTDTGRWEGLIGIHWTAWFWLSIAAALGVAASAISFYARRVRSP